MPVDVVKVVFAVLGGYLLVGIVFAVLFVSVGVTRVDPAASHSSLGFKLIIIPGVVALWPWLAHRWRRKVPHAERNAHRDLAMGGRP